MSSPERKKIESVIASGGGQLGEGRRFSWNYSPVLPAAPALLLCPLVPPVQAVYPDPSRLLPRSGGPGCGDHLRVIGSKSFRDGELYEGESWPLVGIVPW